MSGESKSSGWSLEGRTAVVTGGSKGIGYACAKRLKSMGAAVLICGRDAKAVDKAVVELGEGCKGGSVFGVACDVGEASGRELLVEAAKSKLGDTLHCLVNNVGTNVRAKIEDSTVEEYTTMMRTNVDSCFFLTKAFIPMLQSSGGDTGLPAGQGGSIVNIASVAGLRSSGTGSIYAATKGAMIQLTRSLGCELASRHGIRVNCVAPWMTYTPLLREASASKPELLKEAEDWTPLHRLAEPEEPANAVAFLALPASSYVTGQVLAVDGGIDAQGFSGPCARM